MGLLEDIRETALEIKRVNKKDSLLECREEILLMIEEKIPLTKQIELLIKNDIVDSIDLKYYRNILKSDFGYSKDKKEPINNISVKENKQVVKTTNDKIKKEPIKTPKKTVTEMLSQSIELEY